MAPAERSPSFQKLRLNTRASKPIPSTFASIRRHDGGDSPGSPFPELGDDLWHHNRASSTLTSADLIRSALDRVAPDVHVAGIRAHSQSPANGHRRPYLQENSSLEQSFRNRQTSISFAPQVMLETGNSLPMDAPLPRADSQQDASRPHYDGANITGELVEERRRRLEMTPYRTGESRHPLLQETVDDLAQVAQLEESDRIASLTSGTTLSTNDGTFTPLDSSIEYLQSPLAASSPIEFPPGRSRQNSSVKSKSIYSDRASQPSSLRRSARRTSTRSGISMSPASAFLSQWGRDESAIEPDEEGQEIPDHSGYFIGKQIGFGGFSVVKEVSTMEDGVKIVRAVKIVRKQVTGKNEAENEKLQTQFEHEVEIWRYLKHPYILPLLAVYDTPFATFCITELNLGGTLFDLIRVNRRLKKQGIPSRLAKRYLYQLASALRYLHEDVHVVHRDVKLENCLLDMSDPAAETEGGNVLLCDFGMADFITNENRSLPSPMEEPSPSMGPSETSTCPAGSMEYAAPELLHSRSPLYSTSVDIWAYGVVAYTLLTGHRPFSHSFQPALVMLITKGEWDEEALRDVGADEDAIELIRGCLEMDSDLRWSIADVLESRWFEGCRELYEDVQRHWIDSA
ncbi:serine/threonine-protein kinase-like protein DCLK1 [Phyllosticta citribraziliensis]|uniref:Serine/threonine-protein kinase-like protein DCLK1 n=1 Tax=Phyllosticta citribraziliensis TaxID=989973 RepID=A0ABR1L668_9PEZI